MREQLTSSLQQLRDAAMIAPLPNDDVIRHGEMHDLAAPLRRAKNENSIANADECTRRQQRWKVIVVEIRQRTFSVRWRTDLDYP